MIKMMKKIRKLEKKVRKILKKNYKINKPYVCFESASVDLEETDWIDINGRCGFEDDMDRNKHFIIKNIGSLEGVSFIENAIIIANRLAGMLDNYESPVEVIDTNNK